MCFHCLPSSVTCYTLRDTSTEEDSETRWMHVSNRVCKPWLCFTGVEHWKKGLGESLDNNREYNDTYTVQQGVLVVEVVEST